MILNHRFNIGYPNERISTGYQRNVKKNVNKRRYETSTGDQKGLNYDEGYSKSFIVVAHDNKMLAS